MAIGAVKGTMLSTSELEEGAEVLVDHEKYTVEAWGFLSQEAAVVYLAPPVGDVWPLEVRAEDLHEPMWETF